MTNLVRMAAWFWACVCVILLVYVDFGSPALVVNSDYLMTFHTAGWIADHGQWSILYPQAGASTFAGEPFDQKAHELLPLLQNFSVAEYMYMPVSAYLFAPLSRLTPSYSLFAFQLISLACIALSAWLCLGRRVVSAFLLSLAFLPTFLTLWIGQVGLVFGLLPLSLGFYLARTDKGFLSGLALSLLSLKPQMLIPAGYLLFLSLLQKRFSIILGFISGGAAIFAVNYALFGKAMLVAWLECLKLSDRIYSDPNFGVNVGMATSLPRAVLHLLPPESRLKAKLFVYAGAFILACLGLVAVYFVQRGGSSNVSAFSTQQKLKYALCIGCLALPCVVPHLFFYDLCVLLPTCFFALLPDNESADKHSADKSNVALVGSPSVSLRLPVLALFLCVTGYCLALFTLSGTTPLLLVGAMLIIYLSVLVKLIRNQG